MNKTDLAEDIARRCDTSKVMAENCLSAVLDSITEALARGDRVQLVGFGTFQTTQKASRVGRNPITGEQIAIQEKKSPSFKAGKALRDAIS